MSAGLTVYGDSISGNCLKVKWLLDHLGLAYAWREVDVTSGYTGSPEFLALNPAGQVPVVVFEDGRTLSQSNAILLRFGEGTALVPADPYDRARMYEWLFWEQYSHEPYIAVRRFQMRYLGKDPSELDPKLFDRGSAALNRMEAQLAATSFLVAAEPTLADLALVAYTRMAGEGGFDLALYPAVSAWIARVEAAFGIP
jgi:glutathione S-transferase